jgi:hypothetical protein
MIQIGIQPLSAPLGEAPRPDPDNAICGHPDREGRLGPEPSEDASDGSLFVSPPPMPFPRVFPGL